MPAVVGVIQTSFERDHNSDAGIEGFERLRARLPWIEFQYYDEHSVDDFYEQVTEVNFSAIVYASNSLWNASIFESSRRAGKAITSASAKGMGIVILQQFLPSDVTRECDFVPLAHQVTFSGVTADIKRIDVDRRALKVDSQQAITVSTENFGDRAPVLRCEVKPLYPREWRAITTAHLGDREAEVILRTRTPRARTIVSALPLDWMANSSLLAHAISRAVRGRGTLYLHPEGEDAVKDASAQLTFGRAVLNGGHLVRHAISGPQDVRVNEVPYRHFSHFLLSRAWTWSDLGSLLGQSRTRLENEGSLTAHARTPERDDSPDDRHPLLVAVSGRPSYLQVADRFAFWFEVNQEKFPDGQTAPVRALATVADAIMSAAADPDAIPQVISIDQVRNSLRPYIAGRLGNSDNVDGHVLPTAAIASTMKLLGYDAAEVAPLCRWIEKGKYTSSAASVQQAKLWLPDLNLSSMPMVNTEIDKIYQALLLARTEGHDSPSVEFLCGVLQDPGQSLSLRAIVAEALTQCRDYLTLAKVAGSARTLQGDLERSLTAAHPSLEAVCLLTAALIRIHAASGLSCGLPTLERDDRTPGGPNEGNSALRRELEQVRHQRAETDARITAAQQFTRRAVGASITMGLLLAGVSYAFLVSKVRLDHSSWIEISLAALAGLAVLISYAGMRASRVDGEPRWMSALRDVLSKR